MQNGHTKIKKKPIKGKKLVGYQYQRYKAIGLFLDFYFIRYKLIPFCAYFTNRQIFFSWQKPDLEKALSFCSYYL